MASEAEIDLIVNASGALSDVQQNLVRIVRQAENSAPDVTLAAVIATADSITRIRGQLDDVVQTVQASTPDIDIDVDVDEEAPNRLGRLSDILGSVGRTASGVLGTLGRVGLGVGAVGLAASGAVPLVAGLVAELANIGPAAALGVSAMATLQLASGTLRIAMIGVGEAIETAFDPEATGEELAKAMERLSPQARSFVQQLRAMRPALDNLRLNVQEEVFRNFDEVLERLSVEALPRMSGVFRETGRILNEMGHQVGTVIADFAESGAFQTAIDGSISSLRNLQRVPAQVVKGLAQIGTAAAPIFAELTSAAGSAFDRLSERLTTAFETGQMEEAIRNAVKAIAQLGRIAGNVFEGIGNILEATSTSGQGLFGVLETLSELFVDVTASEGFQQALTQLSLTMTALARAVGPLVIELFQTFGAVLEVLGPPVRDLVQVLGRAFLQILQALGPVLVSVAQAFASLIPLLIPIVELATQLITAVLPALNPLFDALGQIFVAMTPFVQQLAENLASQLVPLLASLTPILETLLPPFVELAEEIFPVMTDIIAELGPQIGELSATFADLLVQLAPVIAEILLLAVTVLAELLPVFGPLIQIILELTNAVLGGLVDFLEIAVIPALEILAALLRGDFSEAWRRAQEVALNMIRAIIENVSNMHRRVGDLVSRLVERVVQLAQDMARDFLQAMVNMGNRVTSFFSELPARIVNSLGSPGDMLFAVGSAIIGGLVNGMQSQLQRVRNIAAEVADLVSETISGLLSISSPSRVMMAMGNDIVDGLVLGMDRALPDLRRQVSEVAMTIPTNVQVASTLRTPSLAMAAPEISVFIGAERLDSRIDFRVRQNNDRRDHVRAQGIRR